MQLLLDTHIALSAIADDARLSEQARELIASPRNDVVISAVSIWEISIKHALARGDMPVSGYEALDYFHAAGYRLLDVTPEHAAEVERLPPIHADPFDRLLIAQAMMEPLRLLTHDATVARYSDSIVFV
ncbi:MAG TPA: type II toxin-antitoxin system VapC family toxin [Rhodocyclaceae bacterium]|nr:type II toxin-antitoxin system VapC family toxin [Rhodocyclaceae bacterium]